MDPYAEGEDKWQCTLTPHSRADISRMIVWSLFGAMLVYIGMLFAMWIESAALKITLAVMPALMLLALYASLSFSWRHFRRRVQYTPVVYNTVPAPAAYVHLTQ